MSPAGSNELDRAVFLAALQPDGEAFRALVAERGSEVDWAWLIERATAHNVAALVASRVVAGRLGDRLPAEAVRQLDETREAAVRRNGLARETLRRIAEPLRRADIPFLLVKGSVLGEHVYDEPQQRLFFDLDIVVPRRRVDDAEAVLVALGYELWGADRYVEAAPATGGDLALARRIAGRSMRRFAHELSLVRLDRSMLPIDLHWHVVPRGRLRVSPEGLWEYTAEARVGGETVRVFDHESTLVHLATHAISNRPWSFRLLHLCDFAWAAHRLPLDAGRLRAAASAWGAEADLQRAGALVERGLGTALPSRLQLDTAPSRGLERMIRTTSLIDDIARAAPPSGWRRRRADLEWGLAMGTLASTAILLFAKYSAAAEFRLRRARRQHA